MVNINCTLHPAFQASVLVGGGAPRLPGERSRGGVHRRHCRSFHHCFTVANFITVSLSPISSLFHCRQFRQAEKCVAYAESLGVDTPGGNGSGGPMLDELLGAIRWDIRQLSAKGALPRGRRQGGAENLRQRREATRQKGCIIFYGFIWL